MRSGEAGTADEIERSLRLLPYWWVLRWAWLGEAIWVIYLIETRGLTVGQVLLFDAVFFGSQLLAEIPTGVVADRYGRRTSILWGSLLTSVAFLIFGLAGTLPLLLASYVLFGISGALISGADDAYLFDSLRAVGRGDEFASVAGRLNGLMTLAIAGFTVVGGLMVVVTPLSWPIVASGLISLTATGIAWRLKEPPRERDGDAGAASFLASGVRAGRRVLRMPSLRWIVLLGALPQVAGFVVFTTFQPILVGHDVPVGALGWFRGRDDADRRRRRLGLGHVRAAAPAQRLAAPAARARRARALRRGQRPALAVPPLRSRAVRAERAAPPRRGLHLAPRARLPSARPRSRSSSSRRSSARSRSRSRWPCWSTGRASRSRSRAPPSRCSSSRCSYTCCGTARATARSPSRTPRPPDPATLRACVEASRPSARVPGSQPTTRSRPAALQFVRKVSGFRQPAAHNAAVFDGAVEEVAAATRRLLDALQIGGRASSRAS